MRWSRSRTGPTTSNPEVVLVTGASSGIGRACADLLAERGVTVVGASRHPGAGQRWEPLVMDVDQDRSVTVGVDQVLAGHGRLDAVVAAAGWGLAGPVEHTPIDLAKAQVETNFWGVVRVVQAALPVMRDQGGGRLVLISSIGGAIALPFQAFYSASKFALEGWAEALAYEVGPFGIDVTLVQPGNIRTGFTAGRRTVADTGQYTEDATRAVETIARDELAGPPPSDVAAVVARLLTARRPPRRQSVGNADERLGLLAKRLLPQAVFERLARGSLGL